MRNKKEWFSANELAGVQGLPNTPQGVNKKARTQGWKKRNREGIQGGGFEYHYSSLPDNVQQALGFTNEQTTQPQTPEQQSNDELLQRIKQLETNLARLIEIQQRDELSSPPEGVNNEEWRLVCYYRQCDKERQAMLLSSAESLAAIVLNEKKEKTELLEDSKVA